MRITINWWLFKVNTLRISGKLYYSLILLVRIPPCLKNHSWIKQTKPHLAGSCRLQLSHPQKWEQDLAQPQVIPGLKVPNSCTCESQSLFQSKTSPEELCSVRIPEFRVWLKGNFWLWRWQSPLGGTLGSSGWSHKVRQAPCGHCLQRAVEMVESDRDPQTKHCERMRINAHF